MPKLKPQPSTAAESTTKIPPSTTFCAEDADVIIRAEGALDFRVHKCILSLVSPIFKDMFTIPQPSTDTPDVLPHVDVQDPPGTWERILRTIYPMPNPTIDNLDDLESLLLTAKKYEMQFVTDSHKSCFERQEFIRDDPLRLYAIACAGGCEEQAKYVARRVKHRTVAGRSGVGDLKGLTLDSYHRLISFLTERDTEWNRILTSTVIPGASDCKCGPVAVFGPIRGDLGTPHLPMDEIYFRALEGLSSMTCAGRRCSIPGIKGFIDSVTREKEEACDKFMWQ